MTTPQALTQANLNYLNNLVQQQKSNGTIDNRVKYYTFLSEKGYKYADLALKVVKNKGFAGRTANAYMKEVADDLGKSFTAAQNLAFSKNLMAADLVARQRMFDQKSSSGTAAVLELGHKIIQDYHAERLDFDLDLPAEAWTAFIPLLVSDDKSATWDDMINSDGGYSAAEYATIFGKVLVSAIGGNQGAQNYLSQFFTLGELTDKNPNFSVALDLIKIMRFSPSSIFIFGALISPNEVGLSGIMGIFEDLFGDVLKLFDLARPDMGDVPCEPFVLDLNGDGVKLTGATDGTAYFDLDADGIREKVGWVSAEDGLLVRDLNGNGKIDNINELIGDQTTDSYTILREFDENGDGKITSADTLWNELQVWQDANSNGVMDAGELKSLAHHKITKYAKNDNTLWVLNNQVA